jgi:Sulfotransferase domain
VSVAYVAGTMRSGTTVMGQVLAASSGTILVGEIRPVLTDPARHEHCDCGHPRGECPFWQRVYERADRVPSPDEAARGYRIAQLPRLAARRLLHRPPPSEVAAVVGFLRAIAEVGGEQIVVDLTKTPMGIILWRLAAVDVHVVHCLRSPRAVASAQARASTESKLPREPRAKSYAVWITYNVLTFLLRPLAASYTVARYRVLRTTPRALAARLWGAAGASVPDARDGARFPYQDSHVLAGNPRRARGDAVTVAPLSRRSGRPPPLPDFVIIGAQKAGSTALMQQLRDHPQVFLPAGETRYFRDPWYLFQDPSVLSSEVATTKPGVLRRGIKCPDLLGLDECAPRVLDALGEVQLIAVLREPVARAVSAYYWYMQWGYLPVEPPDIGLRRILDGAYADAYPRAAEILEFGLYGKHLARWTDLFGAERLLVLVDEELRARPERELTAAFGFLGVSTDAPVPRRHASVNTGVYSVERLRFLQRRHRHILREIPGFTGRYLQRPRSPRGWAVDRSVAAIDRLVLARIYPNERPQLAPDVQAQLVDYYRDDVVVLQRLTGRDLTGWLNR